MLHQCSYCHYNTVVKSNLRRHIKIKHENHTAAASNPHPYHQPNFHPQRTAQMIANNMYYANETRAPTKMSVGPNVQRAPTTVSVPPAYQQPNTYLQRTPEMVANNKYYTKETRAPTKISVGPNVQRPSTTISVPPVQHGDGIKIDYDDTDDDDNDEDMDTGDESDNDVDIFDVLVDISTTFGYLQELRKQYRDLLPQVKKYNKDEMESFLKVYSLLKTSIIEEQDGLEGTVIKKQYGKGVTESEGETEEETEGEDNNTDAEDDTEEETVDSEEEEESEEEEVEQAEDFDVKFDEIEEDEPAKEPFFDFVFEAENFMDAKSKAKLEKYLIRDKKNLKLADGCDQDETDIPNNVPELMKDINGVISMWNKKEEECFKQCSKRKILSMCNIANNWMDATTLKKMKEFNPTKYRFLKNMLSPHKKSLEKLISANVSIHEKRKTLQKPQVGEGLLHTATNLVLPLLRLALKR